jgi:hypothetical protein
MPQALAEVAKSEEKKQEGLKRSFFFGWRESPDHFAAEIHHGEAALSAEIEPIL